MASRTKVHYAWVVLGATLVIMLLASGLRAVFGVYIKPMEATFGWDRASLSGVAALSLLLLGAVGPFVGWLADRWGPRRVIVVSCCLLGLGTLLSSRVMALWQIYITAGILMSVGGGGVQMSTAASVIARWFDSRRGLVLGILGGAMSAGQLVIVPLAMGLTLHYGWRQSYIWLGIGLLVISVPLACWFVKDEPAQKGLRPFGANETTSPAGQATVPPPNRHVPVSEAMQVPAFWLLAGTFFVCGYTTGGLILTHLVPHAADHGFSEMDAAQALGVMGAMNIIGTIASGWICDRYGRKGPLSFYYGVRGLSLLFLLYVWNLPSLEIFAAIFGLNYISTVPATTALTANIFGRYSIGTLSGWIYLSHQVGAALGAALGGWIFSATGSYSWAFISGALLAFLAAGMALAIKEEPMQRTPRPASVSVPATAS
ncbi:MAG TPA: MFS transporter [Candidatus Methylomirabilis sp.]|nr:MFS transporter [Candidatus Methylomirabilis sp.]